MEALADFSFFPLFLPSFPISTTLEFSIYSGEEQGTRAMFVVSLYTLTTTEICGDLFLASWEEALLG